jgi:hypothetical protein
MPLIPATAVKDMVTGTEINLYAIDQLSISEVALVKAPRLNNLGLEICFLKYLKYDKCLLKGLKEKRRLPDNNQ